MITRDQKIKEVLAVCTEINPEVEWRGEVRLNDIVALFRRVKIKGDMEIKAKRETLILRVVYAWDWMYDSLEDQEGETVDLIWSAYKGAIIPIEK